MTNMANFLTVTRLILSVVIFYLLVKSPIRFSYSLAFLLFLVGAATDYLDGFFARSQNRESDFGKIMDPIADKLQVLLALSGFYYLGIVKLWMVVIILLREAAISIIRIYYLRRGKILVAREAGKYKTFFQMTIISIIFIVVIIFKEINPGPLSNYLKTGIDTMMFILITITLYSGFIYLESLRTKHEK